MRLGFTAAEEAFRIEAPAWLAALEPNEGTGGVGVANPNGGLIALYQKCPHLGCRVPFCSTSKQFECPCHGSVFNIKGEYIQGPTPRGMDRFAIRIEGDRVVVDTGSVEEGPARGVLTGPSEPAGPSCLGEEGGTGMDEHMDGTGMDEHMDEASPSPGAMP